ncbi:MAG: hypothetical protein GY820_37705, partial [Gammaproteobacteria bacterium]|nr:hypothetical protein [Gammaproteobacteria bacterium]
MIIRIQYRLMKLDGNLAKRCVLINLVCCGAVFLPIFMSTEQHVSLKHRLARQYGVKLPSMMNSHCKDLSKLSNKRNSLLFLRTCKRENIIPRGFRIKNRFGAQRFNRVLLRASQLLLRKNISETFAEIRRLELLLNGRWHEFLSILSGTDLPILDNLFRRHYLRCFTENRKIKQKKLEGLRKEKNNFDNKVMWPNKNFRNSLVVNCSEIQFNDSELDVLALGPKFANFPEKLPISDIVAGIQPCLRRIPNGGDALAASVSRLIHKAKKACTLPPLLSSAIKGIKSKIRENQAIVLSADKGSKTVIMNRQEYLEKVESQLSNTEVYERQRANCNPISRCHKVLATALKDLDFDAKCRSKLLISEAAAVISRPYGLPKIHKAGMPLRLIVPMIGTVSYTLSRQIDKLLRPIVNKIGFRIQSGDDFLRKLSQLNCNTNQIFLGSLDVVALFPNVDVPYLLQKLPRILTDHESLWKNTENPLSHLSAQGVTSIIKSLC